MRVRSRRASRKKGKKNKRKAYNRIGRLHKRIKQRREAYQWQVANKIVKRADAVTLEDLNIKGMSARCKSKKDEKVKFNCALATVSRGYTSKTLLRGLFE